MVSHGAVSHVTPFISVDVNGVVSNVRPFISTLFISIGFTTVDMATVHMNGVVSHVLRCVAVYCSVLQCVTATVDMNGVVSHVLRCVAVCCSVLQCVAATVNMNGVVSHVNLVWCPMSSRRQEYM